MTSLVLTTCQSFKVSYHPTKKDRCIILASNVGLLLRIPYFQSLLLHNKVKEELFQSPNAKSLEVY